MAQQDNYPVSGALLVDDRRKTFLDETRVRTVVVYSGTSKAEDLHMDSTVLEQYEHNTPPFVPFVSSGLLFSGQSETPGGEGDVPLGWL